MIIQNSTIEDIDEIHRLYAIATAYQQQQQVVQWPQFERSLIETEIEDNRQWKIIIDNNIACIWATTFNDPLIWKVKNEDPAIYIHRIATNPAYRGRNLVAVIVDWAIQYAKTYHKKFIRMDTVGENKKLIKYYTHCGFNFIGLSKLENTKGLPAHYDNATVSLFELAL